MKKRILAIALVVCLLATALVSGTLAYFTDTDDATNTFTVGNVSIDLTEPKWDEAVQKMLRKYTRVKLLLKTRQLQTMAQTRASFVLK